MAVVVGLLLLVAAGLKVLAPADPNTPDVFPPVLQWLAVQAEVLTGAWLLTGRSRVTAWLAAVALFAVLAVVSLSSALAGQSDCGCFGRLAVNPWVTSALNLACLAALGTARPSTLLADYRRPALIVATLAGLVAIAAATAVSPVGETWLARLRGEPLLLTPAVCDLGPHCCAHLELATTS